MPKIDLGRVVGRDAGFGPVTSTYVNDGGTPGVSIEATGEDSAKEFNFQFKNLVREPATMSEVENIVNDVTVTSSNVITAGIMSSIWAKIKEKFAPKSHKHDADDITTGQLAAALIAEGLITEEKLAAAAVTTAKIGDKAVTTAKIADGAVGQEQLDDAVWDSISRSASKLNFGSGINSLGIWGTRTSGMTLSFSYSDGTSCRIDILSNGTVKVS